MEPAILWMPTVEEKEKSNLGYYAKWLGIHYGVSGSDYKALWEWTVQHPDLFWKSITEYFDVIFHSSYNNVMSEDAMPHTQWFKGSTLNYAEHVFRNLNDNQPAILFQSEQQSLTAISWKALKEKTAALQSWFIKKGIKPGERIAAYLPNIPEASVALLATMATGAVWSSCSPDFGIDSVIERFKQIEPKVLIAVDGYTYNGRVFNRLDAVRKIKAALPTVEQLIVIPYLKADDTVEVPEADNWNDVMQTVFNELHFVAVPFEHPIWILYSSGTTGMPKAITHGHGGVLLEHYKYLWFHNDVKPGEKFFWFTTTGWMMWNYLHGALLAGATIVLYDGSPGYPDMNTLWNMTEQAGLHHFGTSAPYIMACKKAGMHPRESYDLSTLRSISSTGSPLPPEGFDYVYEVVKKDVWLCSMSGGTDVCTAFVGGIPWRPVYEGEIQGRALGCSMYAFDEDGNVVIDEVGEMVITKPMPSMPVFFWNDPDFGKYISSYFETYPGIWRHGDWLKITSRDGVVILGRSDATLNRQGVRIGTAEIYRAVDTIEKIKDCLVVNVELPEGGDYMPLFVVMKDGIILNDDIRSAIKNALRTAYSPRHVPDEIIQVKDLPYTMSGKKMEMPVKKILMGKEVNDGAVKNPESLEFFKKFQRKK
ncbi:MAG: acetoacetate--CoA ligase [Chitinophagaceae bacterium]|nr:acetoacetate--CoA ligase [Chitinophagaceae bacterium]